MPLSEDFKHKALLSKDAPFMVLDADDFAYIEKVSSRVYPDLERKPGKSNWVDHAGGLPSYIERIAKHLHYEKGMTIGRAIATAVNQCKKWAAGVGNTNPDTKAKAAKAIAEWEAKKVKSRAKTALRNAKKKDTSKAAPEVTAEMPIVKVAADQQMVFGWAYVTHDHAGELNVDKSGEFVDDTAEIEKAAYNFMLTSRNGDADHDNVVKSTMVESMVFTPEKCEALGIEEGTVPAGAAWWVGFKIHDSEVWSGVKKGLYKSFSVHGTGTKKEVHD